MVIWILLHVFRVQKDADGYSTPNSKSVAALCDKLSEGVETYVE